MSTNAFFAASFALFGALCAMSGIARSSNNHSSLPRECRWVVPIGNTLGIKTRAGIVIRVDGGFLEARAQGTSLTIPVSQPDFGKVVHIAETQSGLLAVIGEQVSFLLDIRVTDGKITVRSRQELPGFFRTQCGSIGRLLGLCHYNPVFFSETLGAVFMEGFDSGGSFRSLILGLPIGPIDISTSAYPHYAGDVQPSAVVLLGSRGAALFDGVRAPEPCN